MAHICYVVLFVTSFMSDVALFTTTTFNVFAWQETLTQEIVKICDFD